jgi:hypothetical protein
MTARDRTPPAADELRDYREEKETERRRESGAAAAERDPDRQERDHLDPTRAANKPGRDTAPDADGQPEAGVIDQKVTNKGFTDTR